MPVRAPSHTSLFRRTLVPALLLGGALVACSDSPSAPTPTPLPPLSVGAWHLNHLDGQLLPALAAHRLVNGVLEQTFVDSSTLHVNSNGTWQQLTYKHRLRTGLPSVAEPSVDAGTWAATDSGYLFRSQSANRDFVIRAPHPDSLRVVQKLVTDPESGLVIGQFRRTRPAASLSNLWRAFSAKGSGLPALVEMRPNESSDAGPYSWHTFVDSVHLELRPDRSYRHKTFASGWQGAPFGPPGFLAYRNSFTDMGTWSAQPGQFTLVSSVYASHVLHGTIEPDGAITLQHGLGAGDVERYSVRFGRASAAMLPNR